MPSFERDGWVDQGGKYHAFPHHGETGGSGGSGAQADAPEGSGDTADGDAAGNDDAHDAANFATDANSEPDHGNSVGSAGGSDDNPPPGGSSSSTDLAGLNTIFDDPRLEDGLPDGGGTKDGGSDAHGSSGGTQNDDAGIRSTDTGGPHVSVPEPSSILLLTSGLFGAVVKRRRKRMK